MTLEIHLPESLAKNAREYAEREHITVDALIATALAAQLDHATHRRTRRPRGLGKTGRNPSPSPRHTRPRRARKLHRPRRTAETLNDIFTKTRCAYYGLPVTPNSTAFAPATTAGSTSEFSPTTSPTS